MEPLPIVVTARLQARQGQAAALEQQARALILPTRAEQGCRVYALYRCPDREGLFMFFEQWQSREALETHLRQPHVQAFMQAAESLLEGRVAVTIWENVHDDVQTA